MPVYQDTTDPAAQFKTVLAKNGFAIRHVFLLHMGYLLLLSKTQFKNLLVKTRFAIRQVFFLSHIGVIASLE